MVGFLHHQNPMSRFGEVFGSDCTTAATSHNHNVGFDGLWLVAWWKL